MQGTGCYYIFCKNTCVCEVNKLERRFYLVDAQVLPEVFLKVVKAKAADVYRYMNFDQIAEFKEIADTVTL